LGKVAKPTHGPFKIINVQQLPINGTILVQWSPTSVERINIHQLLPFFECYNWGRECCTSVIMTLWPTHTSIHDITTKYPKSTRANKMTHDSTTASQTHFERLLILNLFSQNKSPSHDNLRRVSKGTLLHPFTHHRSGTLDWHVTRATSADSSRLTLLCQSIELPFLGQFYHHVLWNLGVHRITPKIPQMGNVPPEAFS
jgi:hypothetical protein